MAIKELLEKIASQDNLATQYPLYIVYDYIENPNDRNPDYTRFLASDHEGDLLTEEEMEEEIAEYKFEIEDEGTYDEDEIEDMVEEFRDSYEEVGVEEIRKFIGVFLTREAAQEFIDSNSYHYRKPHIYVESAWRNYELQNLLRELFIEYKVETPHFWEK